MAGIVDIAGVEATPASGSASPAGTNRQLQYNNSGVMGGMTWLYNAGGNQELTAEGDLVMNDFDVTGIHNLVAGDLFGFLQTHIHDGDTFDVQAYDTNGAAYVSFVTLTAGNPPTAVLTNVGVNGGTFASRPASPSVGMMRRFTDSNTNTWGATIAGGGANAVLGWYNGTNWTVVGI